MHSFIITNWNLDPQALKPFLSDFPSLHHPDVLLIEPNPSITIDQVRHLKTWLSRKPYQAKTKLALFLQAHTLTLPAQHSLLKSLEEPPPDTIIILSTDHPDALLPTIHSRCQVINFQLTRIIPVIQNLPDLHQLSKLSPGHRLALTTNYTTKNQAISLCQDLIYYLEPQLKTNHQLAPRLRLLQSTLTYLHANINPKLAMENLFLNL